MKWPQWLGEMATNTSVAVLTGAGVSAESGIDTFRGPDGIWETIDVDAVATPRGFRSDPLRSWKWHSDLWFRCQRSEPNEAHQVLARLEQLFDEVTIITQNVDGLHQRAGSSRVLELHGDLRTYRCLENPRNSALGSWGGDHQPHGHPHELPIQLWTEAQKPSFDLPRCSCGGLLRPDVVWFEENLDQLVLSEADTAVTEADLLLVVGTSGLVYPAAGLPQRAKSSGARVIEFNLTETEISSVSDHSALGPATVTLVDFEQTIAAN